ncbi:MAG: Holliday junction resolvase RuvX [Thermodesulfobacteriota bacterium]|jgi:putative Holliday junction resolvase|nr:MAG: Holliday junction resolvase RuvX [Thermodesulfobacteriota bacterium]
MRFLGLDIGSKRIGLALSDELGITAQGLPTLTRTTPENDIRKLLKIAGQHKVEKIVIGLPKNMNGTLGKSAEQVLTFIQRMKEKTAIPVDVWDERLSTVAVNRTLLSANVSRRRRKEVVDKLAAVYILQGFLDRQRRLN